MGFISFWKNWFGHKQPEAAEPVVEVPALPAAGAPADKAVDFPKLFQTAGMNAEAMLLVTKAQELLLTLPEDAPIAVKQKIVEAAFKAFDVPTHKIIGAASAELEALRAFLKADDEATQRALADGARQIAELERQIVGVRLAMERAASDQNVRVVATKEEISSVQPVLGFFVRAGIAVVVRDTPALTEGDEVVEPALPAPPVAEVPPADELPAPRS